MNGLTAQPGKIPYCTTKAGLLGMSRVSYFYFSDSSSTSVPQNIVNVEKTKVGTNKI